MKTTAPGKTNPPEHRPPLEIEFGYTPRRSNRRAFRTQSAA